MRLFCAIHSNQKRQSLPFWNLLCKRPCIQKMVVKGKCTQNNTPIVCIHSFVRTCFFVCSTTHLRRRCARIRRSTSQRATTTPFSSNSNGNAKRRCKTLNAVSESVDRLSPTHDLVRLRSNRRCIAFRTPCTLQHERRTHRCGQVVGRHSNSLRVDRVRCGRCGGALRRRAADGRNERERGD
jgi:hypothetical protein